MSAVKAEDLDRGYVAPSLMAAVGDTPRLSHFEFWPTWLFYFPMKIYGLYLALRHGGLTLPTITDPLFDVGGFHGESKVQIYGQIPESVRPQFAHMVALTKDMTVSHDELLMQAIEMIADADWEFPIVVKPDIGLRGMGVQRIFNKDDLCAYIRGYPDGQVMVFQDMHDYPNEVGLFYIRKPDKEVGRIFSLTLKYFSSVVGDGVSTFKELIEGHARFGRIAHVYLPRHKDKWDLVLDKGEAYRIAFAGSHSRGTVFTDGNHLITPAMEAAWDKLSKEIPEFYFGRFDIRFHDIEDLETLENLKIVEVNGSGAEATHIWDEKTSLWEAYRVLMAQYRYMFEIGAANKKRGFKPMKLRALMARMRVAEELSDKYPQTH